MKKSLFFNMFMLVCLISGCSKGLCPTKSSDATSESSVVANFNGTPILLSDVDSSIKSQLQQFDTQIYQIRKRGLDSLIETKLIEEAAKKEGKTSEDYIKENITSKIQEPSEETIRSIYDSKKGDNAIPFDKAKEQIIAYLKNNQQNVEKEKLLANLRKDAKVEVLLSAPRTAVNISKDAPSVGPKDAPVTIVEFSDYQCPFCGRVRSTIWELVDEYKDKIRYVFMDFPLSFHKQSEKAHEAALCAGEQDKYFEYNKKLFANQRALAMTDLKKHATDLSLNSKKFDKCLDSGKFEQTVMNHLKAGMEAGVSGTPAYFINGIMISGAQPKQEFVTIIESELKK